MFTNFKDSRSEGVDDEILAEVPNSAAAHRERSVSPVQVRRLKSPGALAGIYDYAARLALALLASTVEYGAKDAEREGIFSLVRRCMASPHASVVRVYYRGVDVLLSKDRAPGFQHHLSGGEGASSPGTAYTGCSRTYGRLGSQSVSAAFFVSPD